VIFHSFAFVVFFAALLPAYWRLGHRQQNALLLAASYLFYGFVHPWFVGLLFFTTLVDYLAGLGIGRFPGRRKALLALSLASNLGVLGFFKYFGFFAENVVEAGNLLGLSLSRPELDVLLPVGLSFYTFQSLSYTIDVYRGTLQPRRDFLEFATFLALFPQLVAGPIERAAHMLPQVERPRSFDPDRARGALVLMAWGFFKKLVVADNVAVIANRVFTLDQPGLALLGAGTLAFCVQIYADFSAYSDIAIGSARLLGLELMKNFDHPYLSETPREFWRRWHISLSSWFRDYVYVPLGGNRVAPLRHRVNLMASFLLSGLWHGASWNFVLWGAYHGFLLLFYQAVERVAPFLVRARALMVPRVAVFFVLTNIGWLLFRETDAARLLGYLALRPGTDSADQLLAARYFLGLVLVYAFPLVVDSVLSRTRVYEERGPRLRHALVEGAAVAVLVVGMTFLHSDQPSDFIYFQF
jgi:D-alanyl-lipoteichoic acid acyltransferase DltB (MBOAT superfamily)